MILDFQSPIECGTSAEIRAEVARLLAGAELRSAPLRVSVRIVRAEARYRLVLETTGGLRRDLESSECSELTKPAAVIIALAIDPEAASRELGAAGPEAPMPSSRSASRSDGSLESASATPGAQPPATRAAVDDWKAPREQTAANMPRDVAVERQAPSEPPKFYVRGAQVTDFGTLPSASVGAAVFGGAFIHSIRAEAGVLYLPRRSKTLDVETGKGADIDLIAGALSGCLLAFDARLELGVCTGMEGGWLRGESYAVQRPGRGNMPWLAARLGGLVEYEISPQLAFVGRGDASLRIGRSEFVIEGLGPVHQPAPLGGRVELGLELRFP